MRTLRIGIRSHEQAKARVLALAQGKADRNEDEPHIWVTSLGSLAQLLNAENMALLELIRAHEPQSLTELGALSRRSVPSLSRSLARMEEYGLITMVESGRMKGARVAFERLEIVVVDHGEGGRVAA